MENIGLRFNQVNIGDDVYYYPWFDKETGNHAEPIKTKIKSEPFPIQKQSSSEGVFICDISGYVLMSHLSKDYYPERYVKTTPAQSKHDKYLSSEYSDRFSDYLGINLPKWEYYKGQVRLCSQKYPSVISDYFTFKKDAKADYKRKLFAYKKKSKY
jgi:hypothetical protein